MEKDSLTVAIFLAIFITLWLVGVGLYLLRRNLHPIKARSKSFTAMLVCGCMFGFVTQAVRVGNPDDISCGFRMFYANLLFIVIYVPLLITRHELVFKYYWNREKLLGVEGWYDRHRWMLKRSSQFVLWFIIAVAYYALDMSIAYGKGVGYPNVPAADPACNYKSQAAGTGAITVILVLWAIYLVYRMRNIDDAFRIRLESIFMLIVNLPPFIMFFIFSQQENGNGIPHKIGLFIYSSLACIVLFMPIYYSYEEEIEQSKMNLSRRSSVSLESVPLIAFHLNEKGAFLEESESLIEVEMTQNQDTQPPATPTTPTAPSNQSNTSADLSGHVDDIIVQVENVDKPTTPAAKKMAAMMGSHPDLTDLQIAVDGPQSTKAPHKAYNKTLTSRLLNNVRRGSNTSTVPPVQITGFQDVLKHPRFLDAFVQFCVQSWCSESIAFYRCVAEMKLRAGKGNKFTAAEIKQVLDDYIVEGASRQVNIPEVIRNSVISKVNAGATTPDVFDPAFQSVFQLLKTDVYPRFRTSKLFSETMKSCAPA